MQVFITGTDTDVGKSFVTAWLLIKTGYDYFKPIQTGVELGTDSQFVKRFIKGKIFPESYSLPKPLSPHLSAKLANSKIEIEKITLPKSENLLVEGAGGLMVPINDKYLMVDLIKKLDIPVILVARAGLGTINHTLMSVKILKDKGCKLLGVIVNGENNNQVALQDNMQMIEHFGDTKILAYLPKLPNLDISTVDKLEMSKDLYGIFKNNN